MTTSTERQSHELTTPIIPTFPEDLEGLIDHIAKHVDRVLVGGTTGMGPFVAPSQSLHTLSNVLELREEGGYEFQVQYGILETSHDHIAQMAEGAHGLGADEILIAPNYGMETFDPEEAEERIAIAVTKSKHMPTVLYEPPAHSSDALMPASFIRKMCQKYPCIKAMKDSGRDAEGLIEMHGELQGLGLDIHVGNEAAWLALTPEQKELFKGLVAGNSNVDPELFRKLLDENQEEHAEALSEIHSRRYHAYEGEGHRIRSDIISMINDLKEASVIGDECIPWDIDQNFPRISS